MITIYLLKPKFQKLLMPVMHCLHDLKITPTMITVYAMLLSLFTGVVVWLNPGKYSLLLLSVSLLLRMALNALDGMMATSYDLKSKKGEVLNEIGDIFSDACMYLPLMKVTGHGYLIFLFVTFSILNEFAGVLSKAVSGKRAYDGPMGKSDRALMTGVFALLVFFNVPVLPYSFYIFGGACFLIMVSTSIRLYKTVS